MELLDYRASELPDIPHLKRVVHVSGVNVFAIGMGQYLGVFLVDLVGVPD